MLYDIVFWSIFNIYFLQISIQDNECTYQLADMSAIWKLTKKTEVTDVHLL